MHLYSFIKKRKVIEGQKTLIEEVSNDFGWSQITIIKHLKTLEKLGLIEIDKSMKNSWTNIIRVVT